MNYLLRQKKIDVHQKLNPMYLKLLNKHEEILAQIERILVDILLQTVPVLILTILHHLPLKQISSSSAAILKRMSWNNEQINRENRFIINYKIHFESVHSSSGVSSTGSFLFSTDEDSSITTTSSSIPSIVPSTVIEKDDTNSASDNQTIIGRNQNDVSIDKLTVQYSRTSTTSKHHMQVFKKRNQQNRRQKILNDNDVHSSTHTIVYESSKSTDETRIC